MVEVFACPVCGAPLLKEERRYACKEGHSFDLSAKRYVNLLVGADGAVHGDNKEMILARHRFLSGGWYGALLEKIKELCLSVFPSVGVWLDCGCGEGYYTAGICEALANAQKSAHCIGVDISKDAVILAGKSEFAKKGALELAVASVYHLPIRDESC
ncbi:MAG: methyltransferase domain-containing protein, partial [Clostridia bacterium]|nr:methyltransferase domain-containing protein [Clostridia bacterium]